MKPELTSEAERLGQQIRALRRTRGLTLVQLAAAAGLSHPFLSQLERGLARPSMGSLAAISRALGSSQLELLAGAADRSRELVSSTPTLVRAGEGDTGPYGSGQARLLVQGDRQFHPMLFDSSETDPGGFHTHGEDEFVHVLEGQCTVDLGDKGVFPLEPGDSLYYVGGTLHRWHSTNGSAFRLFIVKQHASVASLDGLPEGTPEPDSGAKQEATE
ncbi:MAG TPA: helix-turn-helix domain-containing protein [Glaciihabitans sp.]|jgi:transcriptional regulator with XRE-family HTH domain|nr:helix-turn-helix domain-containing protein [Glaciihabitans sp.]